MFVCLDTVRLGYYILDTSDMSVDFCSRADFNKAVSEKIGIASRAALPIGVKPIRTQDSIDYNKYMIYICDKLIFRGAFDVAVDGLRLYGHKIDISDIVFYKNFILVTVKCVAWCKYDFELPMMMEHIVAIKYLEKKRERYYISEASSMLVSYFKEPVIVVKDDFEYNKLLSQTRCRFPSNHTVIGGLPKCNVSNNSIILYGQECSSLPHNMNACQSFNFVSH